MPLAKSSKSSTIPVCLSESCLSHDVTRALCYCIRHGRKSTYEPGFNDVLVAVVVVICFSSLLNNALGKRRGTLSSRGNRTYCFSHATPKQRKRSTKHFRDAGWLTNSPRFQGARSDHVRVEILYSFPRPRVAFSGPR